MKNGLTESDFAADNNARETRHWSDGSTRQVKRDAELRRNARGVPLEVAGIREERPIGDWQTWGES